MDDLISRAEAVKAICGDCVWYNTASCEGEEWECDSVNKLRSLPSAEAEDRPTGEWVFDTQIPIGKGAYSAGYRCSICGKDYFRVDGMNFCPNCGARMRPGLQGKHFDSIIIDESWKGADDEF